MRIFRFFSNLRSPLPVILQTEATECGLACLTMIANFYGYHIGLAALRRRFPLSLRGATLAHIIRFADQLGMTSRPLRVELEDLAWLKTPCILHWDMSHFVVLRSAGRRHIVIHDPACGHRKITYAQASRPFTRVAPGPTTAPPISVPGKEKTPPLSEPTRQIISLGICPG